MAVVIQASPFQLDHSKGFPLLVPKRARKTARFIMQIIYSLEPLRSIFNNGTFKKIESTCKIEPVEQ